MISVEQQSTASDIMLNNQVIPYQDFKTNLKFVIGLLNSCNLVYYKESITTNIKLE